MWDPNIGMGTVTHQNIGYLFPMGPYYWILDKLGVPDWVAQRLWLGSILFFAGVGVLYLLRTFGIRGPGVVVAARRVHVHAVHARLLGADLGAAAAVGGAAVDDRSDAQGAARRRLAVSRDLRARRAGVGGVNATALIFAGVGPVLVDRCTRGWSTARSTGGARSA